MESPTTIPRGRRWRIPLVVLIVVLSGLGGLLWRSVSESGESPSLVPHPTGPGSTEPNMAVLDVRADGDSITTSERADGDSITTSEREEVDSPTTLLVVDEDGKGITGAHVALIGEGADARVFDSDEDGRASIRGRTGAKWMLVWHQDHCWWLSDDAERIASLFAPAATEPEIVLRRGERLEGRVLVDGQPPPPGFELDLFCSYFGADVFPGSCLPLPVLAALAEWDPPVHRHRAHLSESGRFWISGLWPKSQYGPGSEPLLIWRPDHFLNAEIDRNSNLTALRRAELHDDYSPVLLQLTKGGVIEGRLVDSRSDRPVEFATVFFDLPRFAATPAQRRKASSLPREVRERLWPFDRFEEVCFADEMGRFEIPVPLPFEKFTIHAAAESSRNTTEFMLSGPPREGDRWDVGTLRVDSSDTIGVRVVDGTGVPIRGAIVYPCLLYEHLGREVGACIDDVMGRTDERGECHLSVPPWAHAIEAIDPGFEPSATRFSPPVDNPLVIRMKPVSMLRLATTSSRTDGPPLVAVLEGGEDFAVESMLGEAAPTWRFERPWCLKEGLPELPGYLEPATRESDGVWIRRVLFEFGDTLLLAGLRPGIPLTLRIELTTGGELHERALAPLLPGEQREISIELPALTGPFQGRVVDAAGEPLPGTQVFFGTENLVPLEGKSWEGTFVIPPTAAHRGRFEVREEADAVDEPHEARVFFYESDVALPPAGEELILRSPETRDVQVWIEEPGGKRSGACWDVGWVSEADGHFVRSAEKHRRGRWSLRLPSRSFGRGGGIVVRIQSGVEVHEQRITAGVTELHLEVMSRGSLRLTTRIDLPDSEGHWCSYHYVIRGPRRPGDLLWESLRTGSRVLVEDLLPGAYEVQLVRDGSEFETPMGPVIGVEVRPGECIEVAYPE
jgi:hypothetical protein